MKSTKFFFPVVAVLIAALLLTVGILVLPASAAPSAGPLAATTPVASVNSIASASGILEFAPVNSLIVTSTARGGPALNVQNYEVLDLQYNIDQGTTNTVTLKLQSSNDNLTWDDQATIVSNNAADAHATVQTAAFGRYMRLHYDATNTNPLTVTVIAVGK